MIKEQLDRHVAVLIEKRGEEYRKMIEAAGEFFMTNLAHFSDPGREFHDMHGMIDRLCDEQEVYAGKIKKCVNCGDPVTQCGCCEPEE